MSVTIHWTAFTDGEWACGEPWPEPVSKRPFVVGPDYPRVSVHWRDVTCEACRRLARTTTPATAGSTPRE